ncbi:F-box/FBD/LRR-repeat protein At1g13570-like [Camellia sinensis]|uniref:F-box/FBD/LRR-repeat protein At1g13570-like n=1 Tax=Camellia sinensis TaxID=4442 RepID=UPI001035ABAE|nr:F-box/FBD/LRR-repeat protein At1g13570-like [Camellia sinensis]
MDNVIGQDLISDLPRKTYLTFKGLTRLELIRCELDPPLTSKGFLCFKYLNLQQVLIAPDVVESLISSCPLLESLTLSYFDSLALTICAPNLKHLCLEGEFKDICLKNTPLLLAISVAMYMTDDIAEHFEQSSSCNFDKFLGSVPCLERLIGHIYFTKYLSIGNDLGKLPVAYNHLKVIELYQVSFEDMKERLVVLRLIVNSPCLQELQISVSNLKLIKYFIFQITMAIHLFISLYCSISNIFILTIGALKQWMLV